jgi:hypothetical protein
LLLQALDLLLKLLIAILQLLDLPREFADCSLEAIDPRHEIARRHLGAGAMHAQRACKRQRQQEGRAAHPQQHFE